MPAPPRARMMAPSLQGAHAMANRTPRGPYPGTRRFERVKMRRFDLGLAANDGVAPEPHGPRDGGGNGPGRRPR